MEIRGSNRARRRTRRSLVVALAALPLVAAACGSDDDDAESTAAPTTSASTATSAPGSTAPSTGGGATTTTGGGAVDLDAAAVKYVGGKAQAATGSVIKIGIANGSSGASPSPQVQAAAEKAIKYANEKLNGIRGHKLEMVFCDMHNDETGQKCGTQFANDSGVQTIVMGLHAGGTAPFYKVIDNKKAIVQTVPIQAADFDPYPGNTKPNVFNFGAGVGGQSKGAGKYLATIRQPKPKNVAIVAVNSPGALGPSQALQKTLQDAGITAKIITVEFGSGQAAIASALQAGGANTADTWFPYTDAGTCVELYKYQQANKLTPFTMHTGACNSPGFVPLVGALMPEGWVATDPGTTVLVPSGEPIELLIARELDAELKSAPLPQYPAAMMLGILNNIKAQNLAPEGATVEQIAGFLRNLPGPIVENPVPVPCGSIPGSPTLCGVGTGLIQSKGGKLVRLSPTAELPIIDYTK